MPATACICVLALIYWPIKRNFRRWLQMVSAGRGRRKIGEETGVLSLSVLGRRPMRKGVRRTPALRPLTAVLFTNCCRRGPRRVRLGHGLGNVGFFPVGCAGCATTRVHGLPGSLTTCSFSFFVFVRFQSILGRFSVISRTMLDCKV